MSFSLILIFLVVLINIVAGFYAAICLGYGPPTVRDAVDFFISPRWKDAVEDFFIRFRSRKSPKEPDAEKETPIGVPAEKETVDDLIQQIASADLSDLLHDESEEVSRIAPMQEIFDDDLASILMERSTEAWLMNEKHVETSILKLNVVMMKSGRFAAELDTRLRAMRGRAEIAEVKRCLNELRDDCRNYLEAQAVLAEQMQKRLEEFGELKYLAEEIDYANLEQSAQIESTISNLDNLNVTASAEEAIIRLLRELASLRIARHRLRDMREKAFIKIALYEDRIDSVHQQLYFDETTGLRGRIGLDVAITEWWKQKRQEKRQITFSLIDFVDFGHANDEHGIQTCDKLIRLFGKSLEKTFDPLDLVGIFHGNCFMVATTNIGPRKTITEIERIRQRCEKTIYKYDDGNGSLRLRVTCAVTEALATQVVEEVFKNLEQTMATAKKAGRNLTYQLDAGKMNPSPELVDAPNLGEIEKEIDLDAE